MSREEMARDLFAKNFNCAQAVFAAFCEESGLDAKIALKIANGFGGGIRCGEVCGAVSGAIMAIGLKCGYHVENDLQQKNYCNAKSYEFIEKFIEANGSILCRDLLCIDIRRPEDHNDPVARAAHKAICPDLVASAVKVLENMEINE